MQPILSDELIRQALQGITVPPQPQIMVDLYLEQLTAHPDPTAIARLISQDPGLSGALLKLVNSPFFGLANRITSIRRAVNLLGTRAVINLINAQSIKGELDDETIVSLNRFWDTAQNVADACLHLAKRIGYQPVDEAYALGLFHNCGIPLMLKRFPSYMNVLEEAYGRVGAEVRIVDVENRHFSTNHAVVGYFIARAWRLPTPVADAIASHHTAQTVFSADFTGDSAMKNLLAILKMAEHICGCYRALGNQGQDSEWNSISTAVLDYIGLSDHDFALLKENILEMGIERINY
ncbi:HD-like signal output (HDOD) protein [Pseudomonas duriflava]|uniref:HD-like signal output (HDOD) protein n=1 Tax=Pseudomonas duriflava TaxID=459528 RepID=A0A562QDJ2_9PSED|nr:HDOD domain-containing protein [Pseudomonas duriflava]TWI54837.1 HD-like signal output (HDOD) protein [Pseudomonas duriflava]